MELIQNLSNAIDLQQKRQDEDFEEMEAKPLAERVAKGHTLTNLSISKIEFYEGIPNSFCPPIFGNYKFIDKIYIHCENNCSRYREGTTLKLSNGCLNFKMELETDRIDDFVLHSGDFDVKNNIVYTNNPWGYKGEQTFEDFLNGFYTGNGSDSGLPLRKLYFVKWKNRKFG